MKFEVVNFLFSWNHVRICIILALFVLLSFGKFHLPFSSTPPPQTHPHLFRPHWMFIKFCIWVEPPCLFWPHHLFKQIIFSERDSSVKTQTTVCKENVYFPVRGLPFHYAVFCDNLVVHSVNFALMSSTTVFRESCPWAVCSERSWCIPAASEPSWPRRTSLLE